MTALTVLQSDLDRLQRRFIEVYAQGGQVSTYIDAVEFLSRMHSGPEHILRELTENSVDAEATEIIIVIYPDKIEVIDNGSGLNPFLVEDDIEMLRTYFEILSAGDRRPGENINQLGSEGGKKSLGWMNYMVLKSQKRLAPTPKTRGTKGVGFQGVRQLSNQIDVLSRPTTKLAHQYYTDPEDAKNPPVCRMSLPTTEEFERAQIHPTFRFAETNIGFGSEVFGSGTVITLNQLRSSLTERLSLESLSHLLSVTHGVDIRRGLRIRVVDRFTLAGKRGTGVVHTINAPTYKGRPIVNEVFYTRSHKPFQVEVYVVGEKETGDKLTLRRHGGDVVVLSETTLPELRKAPWNSRRLSGFVEFPEAPEADAAWNAAKTEPLESSTRNQWLKALEQKVAPVIESAINKFDQEVKMAQTNTGAKQVADAFNRALSQIPQLNDFHQGTQPGIGAGRAKVGNSTNPLEDRVFVRVVNQFGQGVENVTLELLTKRNAVLERHITGRSGEHSFGEWRAGNYRVRVILREGLRLTDELVDDNIYPFVLPSSLGKGARITLHVHQDDAEPDVQGRSQRPKSYEVVFAPLASSSEIYDSSLIRFGKLTINSDYATVSQIYRLGKPDIVNSLIVGCLVSALGEISEERLPGYSAEERQKLLAMLQANTLVALSERRR